jgi:hypothetical protein
MDQICAGNERQGRQFANQIPLSQKKFRRPAMKSSYSSSFLALQGT